MTPRARRPRSPLLRHR
ncbi:hypothetical protein E2C01_089278 [Portunus trituberculatus]|uniref:Uncharacterized protein n=1 Tax=Portunus trituberculatus TaxID=210409 RepID=A0A5B7JIP1_PORTR|nr:hypothetical protein [Portunus trituberculatus]